MNTIQFIAILGLTQLILIQGVPLKSLNLTCSQYRQIVADQSVIGQILYNPYYIPKCTENGKEWERAQCSNIEKGVCFCVEPSSGEIIKETVTTATSRQALQCSEETMRATSDLGTCQSALAKLRSFVKENPNVKDSPFGYSPHCQENGQFYAMQRNENHFFCVDVDTGDVIPDTISNPTMRRAISEKLCREFSRLWKEFVDLYPANKPRQSPFEVVDETSCQSGFVYQSCGCFQSCDPHGNEVAKSCDICKPACVCPNGLLEYNGTCVTIQKCRSIKTQQTPAPRHTLSWKNFVSIYGSENLLRSFRVEEENVDPNLQRPFIEKEESLESVEEEEEESEEIGEPELEIDFYNITEPQLPFEEPAGEDADEELEEIGEPELEIDFHEPSSITEPQLPFEEPQEEDTDGDYLYPPENEDQFSEEPQEEDADGDYLYPPEHEDPLSEEPQEEDADGDYLYPPEHEDPHFYPYIYEVDTESEETRPVETESVADKPVTLSPTKKSSEINKSQIQFGLNTDKLEEGIPLTETNGASRDKKKFSVFLEKWHRN